MKVSNAHNAPNIGGRKYGWLRLLVAGSIVWSVFGWFTAGLDPNYAGGGLIGAVGGYSNWLGLGVTLMAAGLIILALYRAGGRRRALIGGPFVLGAAIAIATSMNWSALFQIPLVFAGVLAVAFCMRGGGRHSARSNVVPMGRSEDGDGWRYGYDGYGYYLQNMRYMTATSMDDDDS
ncbi:MAG: hypothetical protein PF501_16855 [Salinisphaera sp.]|jgi:hypothetical protein|nr:hypothetical protein [Salinisphaera sp.]